MNVQVTILKSREFATVIIRDVKTFDEAIERLNNNKETVCGQTLLSGSQQHSHSETVR